MAIRLYYVLEAQGSDFRPRRPHTPKAESLVRKTNSASDMKEKGVVTWCPHRLDSSPSLVVQYPSHVDSPSASKMGKSAHNRTVTGHKHLQTNELSSLENCTEEIPGNFPSPSRRSLSNPPLQHLRTWYLGTYLVTTLVLPGYIPWYIPKRHPGDRNLRTMISGTGKLEQDCDACQRRRFLFSTLGGLV
jgi:hypothetical protein